jgi:solute carrier family 25 citrate transporter 1
MVLLLTNGPSRTKLIDDAKGPNPQYRGLIHGTTRIVQQEGIRGIYRGLFPVVSILTCIA